MTIKILKPTDSSRYTDTSQFEAEWMKNTGIFEGEKLGGEACFQPDKTVSGGEFLTMLIKTLDIPTDSTVYTGVSADTPEWLKPYLAAAIRSGLTAGLPETFDVNEAITGAEAAVMLQNALSLTVSADADLAENEADLPAWAVSAVNVLADNGIALDGEATLTRANAAQVLYQVSQLAEDAPGVAVLRAQ